MATRRRSSPPPAAEMPQVRERLLQAGLDIATEAGLRSMTVRAVAQRAQANLGSFVYHFGTRDAFVDALIERWYGPMFDSLRLTAQRSADDPKAALEAVLRQLLAWAAANRGFLAGLLLDAGSGEAGARRFLASLDHRHPALLLALLTQAQAQGQIAKGDAHHQLLFLLGALAMPLLAGALAARGDAGLPPMLAALVRFTTEPAPVAERIAWALRGLEPNGA